MGTYISTVKATNGTASFAIFAGPCRILGIYYVADTTAGTITIKDGGTGFAVNDELLVYNSDLGTVPALTNTTTTNAACQTGLKDGRETNPGKLVVSAISGITITGTVATAAFKVGEVVDQVVSGTNATVTVIGEDGEEKTAVSLGTGPVDAVVRALDSLTEEPNELIEFSVKSVTEGIDAIGDVTIRIEREGQTFVGRGADTDIMVASAQAYMNALNRLLAMSSDTDNGKLATPH